LFFWLRVLDKAEYRYSAFESKLNSLSIVSYRKPIVDLWSAISKRFILNFFLFPSS